MGSYDTSDAVERVWLRLRDYGNATDQQLVNDAEVTSIGIRGAEPIYSRVRPRDIVADLTANGTNFLSLPGGFMDGFSTTVSIETPPDEVPARMLDDRLWHLARNGSGVLRIVFVDYVPANGATVRLTYTGLRTMDVVAANTTVVDADFPAFCDLAASLVSDSIAAKYARTSEPAFNADAVNFRSRAQEWQSIAKTLWTAWERGIGLFGGGQDGSGSRVPAASAWANWDSAAQWGGQYINHPRVNR